MRNEDILKCIVFLHTFFRVTFDVGQAFRARARARALQNLNKAKLKGLYRFVGRVRVNRELRKT